jgi:FAD/FMN-containing dehydrogenase
MSSAVLCSGVDLPGVGDAPYALLFTLEGLDEDITAETEALQAVLADVNTPPLLTLNDLHATNAWADFLAAAGNEATLVRVGLPPGRVSDYWGQLPAAAQASSAWCIDVGNHHLYARADLDASASATWLAAIRKPALGLGGYAVVMATPHAELDRWGYTPDALDLMRAIKQRWDPKGILNPGEFIVD